MCLLLYFTCFWTILCYYHLFTSKSDSIIESDKDIQEFKIWVTLIQTLNRVFKIWLRSIKSKRKKVWEKRTQFSPPSCIFSHLHMIIPPGVKQAKPNSLCKLFKSLYGLKQASRKWHERLTAFLVQHQSK